MAISEIRMSDDQKEGTEASLANWFKAPGDRVSENDPLVEINTDKVTLEIAAPASGIMLELLKQAGDPVLPGELLGTIDTGPEATETQPGEQDAVGNPMVGSSTSTATALPALDVHTTYSPAVRKLLSELGLDPQRIAKVGRGGRLTPEDVGAYLKREGGGGPMPPKVSPTASSTEESAASSATGRKVAHTPMRRSIANHMLRSVQSAPHVTSVFEADLHHVLADREARKQATAGEAVPSVTAYLIHAALYAIKLVPEVNSKWHDAHLEVFDHVNFGVGTALETGGLVVPVIQNAQAMDLLTLSQNLRDMTKKARAGKLTQADMQGGTFTLSNHGVSGSLMAAPIILPHGQAAILGAGKLQKRVIVCETGGRELFRVRPMMYVTLTVDHRVLDGQQTNGFLTEFVRALETPPIRLTDPRSGK